MSISYFKSFIPINHLLLGFLVFIVTSSLGQVVLKDNTDRYHVTGKLDILIDSTDKLSITDIIKPGIQKKFSRITIPYIKGENDQTYWARLEIHNKRREGENQSWYFESFGFDIDEITFYVPASTGSGFSETEMGYYKPFSKRNIYHKNFLFLINLRPGESKTFYIRFRRSYPMRLNFIVRTHELFINHVVVEYWFLGIFYGILSFIILLNLYLFLTQKDQTYLLYLFVVFSEVLYCLGRDGLGFQFVWPQYPWINLFTHHNITQFLFVLSSLIYGIHFLKLATEHRKLYRIAIALIGFRALIFIILFFVPVAPFPVFVLDAIILTIPFIAGIVALKRGKSYTRFYVVAFSFLYLSFILIILDERQLLPASFKISWYMINVGMFLEVVFLAIAMIDQINLLKQKTRKAQENLIKHLKENEKLKDKVNKELEQKVQERTEHITGIIKVLEEQNLNLGISNRELKRLNEKITMMNSLLEKDNKELQTGISELNKSRVLLQDVSLDDFKLAFPDEESCLSFLAELKWQDGYFCKKCGYMKASTGKIPFSRRCKNCNYDESPTSYTLFHRLRFPLTKAFYLVYLVQTRGKSITVDEISEILDLRRETCWNFRKKVFSAKEQLEKNGNSKEYDLECWEELAMIYPLT